MLVGFALHLNEGLLYRTGTSALTTHVYIPSCSPHTNLHACDADDVMCVDDIIIVRLLSIILSVDDIIVRLQLNSVFSHTFLCKFLK